MSSARRVVRVDPLFFDELDAIFGTSRGPNGEPSSTDFLLIDLPFIAEAFAERFEEMRPLLTDRDDYRTLVTTGRLIKAVLVTGQEMADGSIVLLSIEVDPY